MSLRTRLTDHYPDDDDVATDGDDQHEGEQDGPEDLQEPGHLESQGPLPRSHGSESPVVVVLTPVQRLQQIHIFRANRRNNIITSAQSFSLASIH